MRDEDERKVSKRTEAVGGDHPFGRRSRPTPNVARIRDDVEPTVKGLYTPLDLAGKPEASALGRLAFSFHSRIHRTMYRGRLWTDAACSPATGAPRTRNRRFKYLISHGETVSALPSTCRPHTATIPTSRRTPTPGLAFRGLVGIVAVEGRMSKATLRPVSPCETVLENRGLPRRSRSGEHAHRPHRPRTSSDECRE